MDAKRQYVIDSFLAKRRRSEESVIECHGTIIISDEEIDFECDEDEQEVETAEANSGISVLSRFLTSGTSTATRVIERESGQSDSADSSGDDSYDTDLSSEDTEGIPIDQVQGTSGENSYTRIDSSCHSLCCSESSDADKPFQPSINYSVFSKKRQGKRIRHFRSSWYTSFNWLHYCTSRHKVFCFFCCKACRLKLISDNKRRKDAFVSAGFNNWKKSIEKFKEHA